jgi:hypothetical protein
VPPEIGGMVRSFLSKPKEVARMPDQLFGDSPNTWGLLALRRIKNVLHLHNAAHETPIQPSMTL